MSQGGHAFVLAGGRGSRFWPLSRRSHPKQLLDFTGDGSLLGITLGRVTPLIPASRQWILTNTDLAPTIAAAQPELDASHVVAEPVGRNTAPAIALAAALLEAAGEPDAPMLVLPSDHLIQPAEDFRSTVERALDIAAGSDLLLTFGIQPTRPETGYGYIETADEVEGMAPARRVAAFHEKPDRATAEQYLESGQTLWNSGMFAFRAAVLLASLEGFEPEMVASMRGVAAAGAPGTPAFAAALEEAYEVSPSVSIDYALLEKAPNVGVLPAAFQWNDVGHWLAMRDLWPQDGDGNA
ncbi:MAG: mannose-1-phosphate guanylyltransferase, partial [Gemmatimonadetes bacterium]|nr:mannose-1-phosphate guanylyltransferase [Gemmatimonadota bacterium]